MALEVRRIVTGHDSQGKAVVATDERLAGVGSGQGSVCRVVEFAPGGAKFMHRTETLDYADDILHAGLHRFDRGIAVLAEIVDAFEPDQSGDAG
jgi:hypothetical protein